MEQRPTPRDLDALFRPRSVAVVGASRRVGSVGGAVLANMLRGGFMGPVYPVNRRAGHVQSVRAWPELGSLPEVPDLVVVAVPAAEVAAVIAEAARLGVPAACVLTAGFAEVGSAGRERERGIVAIARGAGMRLLGPNCLGVQNPDPAVRLDATFATAFAPDGRIAFASQSGALGLAALEYAREQGIGFSAYASLGNKADLSGNDLLEYWERDERTRVVLLYLESFGNPVRFREIAARVGRKKPVALIKGGRSGAGARAAGSHTGALAGPDAAVAALCAQAGILRARTMEELFDVARMLATQPLPRGRRVGVVTNAGGPGILVADALEAEGLSLPPLRAEGQKALRPVLPAEASVANPVDVLAETSPEQFGAALRALLEDPGIDAAVAIYVPPAARRADEIARAIADAAAGAQKPVLTCLLGTNGVPEGLRLLHEARLPTFRFPEGASRALALAARYADWREKPAGAPEPIAAVPEGARRALQMARRRLGREGGWLDGEEAALLAESWGLTVAPQRRVPAVTDRAVEAAAALGFPAVLKADLPGVVHKTEAGAVVLGLRTGPEVGAAAERLLALRPAGFTVQRQVEGGEEWLVGAVRHPRYGPLMAVGAGGTRAELWRDIEQRLAPLSPADAEALVDHPRIATTLRGFRGSAPGDREALLVFVRRLASCVCAQPEIAEAEANPVRVLAPGEGVVAVDLRVRLSPDER